MKLNETRKAPKIFGKRDKSTAEPWKIKKKPTPFWPRSEFSTKNLPFLEKGWKISWRFVRIKLFCSKKKTQCVASPQQGVWTSSGRTPRAWLAKGCASQLSGLQFNGLYHLGRFGICDLSFVPLYERSSKHHRINEGYTLEQGPGAVCGKSHGRVKKMLEGCVSFAWVSLIFITIKILSFSIKWNKFLFSFYVNLTQTSMLCFVGFIVLFPRWLRQLFISPRIHTSVHFHCEWTVSVMLSLSYL